MLFDSIDGDAIRRAALRTEGAAGLSGIDASGWRRLCCSFGGASSDLCDALAISARRLCTGLLDPSLLVAYTANRLIPLDKCPGVRPIGISEVVWRIIGKAIMHVLNPIVAVCTGPVQLCAGLQAGCEAGVHALRSLFADADTEGVLLVDASNAFDALNRRVTLLNSQVVCPPMARLLINMHLPNTRSFGDAFRRDDPIYRGHYTGRSNRDGYVCHWSGASHSSTGGTRRAANLVR